MAIRIVKQRQSVIGLFRSLNIEAAQIPRTRPFYRRLVDLVERGIASGALSSGFRLPPERDLAAALSVSRATVVTAYRELESRGLVRGYVGRGTFVSATSDSGAPFAWRGKISATAIQTTDTTLRDLVRHAADPNIISLAAGEPALDLFPTDAFRRAVDEALARHGTAAWGHAPTEGQSLFREVLAHRFGGRAANTLVISGAQQGLDLLARCLIDRGDAVVVDRPGYLGAIQSFRSAGARIFGWDFARADIDELEDLFLRYRPKLIYTNPTFQNPSGLTLPVRARRELITLAQRYRVPIVEDETYCQLSLGVATPPALHALDEKGTVVIRVNSFSKVLAPGLRLGWIGATPPIIEQLALMKQQIDPHTQNLIQLVVSTLIDSGLFDRHLSALKAEHRRRRDSMARALLKGLPNGALRFAIPEGGLFFWCRLTGSATARDVQQRALAQGVAIVTGEPFYVDGGGTKELRICFANRTADVGTRAARTISDCVADAARQAGRAPALARIV